MNVRLPTIKDIENKRKMSYYSEVPCSLCGTDTWVKDIRSKNILCNRCAPDREALKRRNFFHSDHLTPQKRKELIRKDPTVSVGPFFRMKKD